jgi:hypothetical protein
MSHTKPKFIDPVRALCPVCGKTAYSQGGIHPQCAVLRADRLAQGAAGQDQASTPMVKSMPAVQPTTACAAGDVRLRAYLPAETDRLKRAALLFHTRKCGQHMFHSRQPASRTITSHYCQ